jgi:regulator of sigma E protease
MSWVLAFAGFCALIVLHELGHFTAAKLVGMRVERFSLFFGRPLWSVRRGETEYGIGWLPAGGYVRITGMDPREEIPEDVAPRAYYRMPVWKRIVVIAAGPAVNLVLAFVIFFAVFSSTDAGTTTARVAPEGLGQPAARYLQPGDRIVSVDGVSGDAERTARQISTHACAGPRRSWEDGCTATTAATVVLVRDGQRETVRIRPRYDGELGRTRLGFSYDVRWHPIDAGEAVDMAGSAMWNITTGTVRVFAKIFDAQERRQLGSAVQGYETTRQAFELGPRQALLILGFISLSLAIINLFPFLPLDGGHIFWAIVEKLRGRAVPFAVMERAGMVGFVLVIAIFFIGLTNDIGRIQDGTLGDVGGVR